MASQSAAVVLRQAPRADGRLDVRLELACGCQVELTLPAERMVELSDGRTLAGGKYPCPAGHPVRRP